MLLGSSSFALRLWVFFTVSSRRVLDLKGRVFVLINRVDPCACFVLIVPIKFCKQIRVLSLDLGDIDLSGFVFSLGLLRFQRLKGSKLLILGIRVLEHYWGRLVLFDKAAFGTL